MSVPAVSILLPTYDGAHYLDAQIGSIIAQDFADFELLIVDDGSNDDTPGLLARWAATDDRIRVLPAAGNAGQKVRLVELVRAASGDLIAFSDQDDVWDQHKLGRLLAAKSDRAIAFGTSEIIDGAGQSQGMTLLDRLPPLPSADDHLIYLFKPMLSAHGMVVDRAAINEGAFHHTHPFDWLMSLDAVFSRGVVYVPDAVTHHRIHASNQSNGRLGRTPSLRERYALSDLTRRINVRQTERWMLVQRLEYLTYSPLIAVPLQQTFRRAHDLCVRAWFDQDRGIRLRDRTLFDHLCAELLPLSRSAAETRYVEKTLRRLVRSTLEPVSFAWLVGSFLRGRRMPRKSA